MDIRGIQVDMLQKRLTQHQRSQILDLSPIAQAVANSDETKKSSVYEIKSKFEIRSPPELDLGPICRHVAVDIVNGLGGNCGLFNLLSPQSLLHTRIYGCHAASRAFCKGPAVTDVNDE